MAKSALTSYVPVTRQWSESRPDPVQRSVTPCIVVHQERTVRLEHEQPDGFRESGRETTGVEDFAAGDEEPHRKRTVLPASDMPQGQSLRHVQNPGLLRAALEQRDRACEARP